MTYINILGIIAGSLTTISFVPQVLKTWKSKSAKDLSLGMFMIFCAGVLLWLVYGLLIFDIPIIAANFSTLILASSLLFFKFKYKE
jgi:MtN3 and saliva related transmembrane protein